MKLLYVVDPMCSWCYGFAPTLEGVLAELDGIEVELVLGGLAPDSDKPMPEAMREYVQSAWHAVTARTGVPFNHDFWHLSEPRRSTYPACRAVILARELDRGPDMLGAIQRAYYQEAKNPSDVDTLVDLARQLGLDPEAFEAGLQSPHTEALLQADLLRREEIGARSFPSLGLERGGQLELVASGCLGRDELCAALASAGVPMGKKRQKH